MISKYLKTAMVNLKSMLFINKRRKEIVTSLVKGRQLFDDEIRNHDVYWFTTDKVTQPTTFRQVAESSKCHRSLNFGVIQILF
jgi:hypothetical protein